MAKPCSAWADRAPYGAAISSFDASSLQSFWPLASETNYCVQPNERISVGNPDGVVGSAGLCAVGSSSPEARLEKMLISPGVSETDAAWIVRRAGGATGIRFA